MSGWLLMGLPGAMFSVGLSSSWIAIGLTLAHMQTGFMSLLAYVPTLKLQITLLLSQNFWNTVSDKSHMLRLVSGLVIMIFFTFYVASGFVSGAVLFENSFGLNYHVGLLIVGGVVVAYTLFGGFLAVSWTDFVQGIIMVVALILVPVVTIMHVNGLGAAFETIKSIDPALLDIFKGTSVLGIISLFAWGLGYVGQPHIIVRFMAISSVKELKVHDVLV